MRPIRPEPSLREQAATWLRNALFTGDLVPGSTFSVPALAEQFGISATPVREAVLDLVQQGLVAPLPSRGFLVVDPTPETIAETVEIRRLLEIPTTCAIAQAVDDGELRALKEMAELTLQHAREGSLRAFVEVDYAFHQRLTGLCGNAMLTELIERLRARSRAHAMAYVAAVGRLVEIAGQHGELIDAMARRDLPAVARVTESHMQFAMVAEEWAAAAESRPAGPAPNPSAAARPT